MAENSPRIRGAIGNVKSVGVSARDTDWAEITEKIAVYQRAGISMWHIDPATLWNGLSRWRELENVKSRSGIRPVELPYQAGLLASTSVPTISVIIYSHLTRRAKHFKLILIVVAVTSKENKENCRINLTKPSSANQSDWGELFKLQLKATRDQVRCLIIKTELRQRGVWLMGNCAISAYIF